MSDQRENRTTWEEILAQAPPPPLPASWKAMEAVLEHEMPVRKTGRRWWILWLLLLLLLGVCHLYRGRKAAPAGGASVVEAPAGEALTAGSAHPGSATAGASAPGAPGSAALSLAGSPASGMPTAGPTAAVLPAGSPVTGSSPIGIPPTSNGAAHTGAPSETDTPAKGIDENRGAITGSVDTDTPFTRSPSVIAPAPASIMPTGQPERKPDERPGGQKDPKKKMSQTTVQKKPSEAPAQKRPAPDAPYRGFTAGLGLNQFFPLGRQVNEHFNAEGTNGTLTDYLPVPVLRYFFCRKLYVQMEAQFNTPQYTSKNLLASQTFNVTGPAGSTSNSVYIRKLFYFNLPLTVHYSPLKHLYTGAGLEFARLTNGVADVQVNRSSGTLIYNDSVLTTKVVNFKGDSVYQRLKTYDWRLTGDLDYQWEGFTLGVRYNWSLNKFINVRVSATQVTQSRNSSLQLYLRYTIWRQKSLRKLRK